LITPERFEKEVYILEDDEITNYKEAITSLNSNEWSKAMKSKMGSMYENEVWNLVAEGVKPID
jgi:hypothetical protein